MKVSYFKNTTSGFNYIFDDVVPEGETLLLKMPPVTAHKRGINDIGFMADENITIYATILERPNVDDENDWQEIQDFDEINKTTAFLKIVNNSDYDGRVIIRAILF